MQISDIIAFLERIAPPALQETYDNAGLIVGNASSELKGTLVCLDSTPEVVDEAVRRGCNLIIAHHPIIFKGVKQLTGQNYVQRTVINAIKNDIAIYAIHTNLDNVLFRGVNGRIAQRLALTEIAALETKESDLVDDEVGAGVIGNLPEEMSGKDFLQYLAMHMELKVIKHTALPDNQIRKIALCGGSGGFLLPRARAAGADVFVTSDIKYHDFFDAEGQILLIDIGHFESERFTIQLICDLISENFPKFAPLTAETNTNPVTYYTR